jgi:hypothetical protein
MIGNALEASDGQIAGSKKLREALIQTAEFHSAS